MKKYIAIAIAAVTLTSCNDFLDREPLDFGDQTAYFTSPEDFALSCNYFYDFLPKNVSLYTGTYNVDNQSDNQASGNQNLFYEGEKKTVSKGESEWNFEKLRAINFFINTAEEAVASGHATESSPGRLDHYIGEGYFFRAYEHFRLLRYFGDIPILTEMLPDDQAVLIEQSKRYPRNEVARFILSDLDKAATMMFDNAPEAGRVHKYAALALKARVALYEATWEKYHAGTCFVPGNEKWVGKKTWPAFSWPLGSAEAEVNYFLDQAISAAKAVADHNPLNKDYAAMFTNFKTTFGNDDEVILARYYQLSSNVFHNVCAHLSTGGNTGITRAAINSFLMADGLPIYASADYQGDEESYYEFQGRDGRLLASVSPVGSVINTREEDGKFYNDTVYYHVSNLLGNGNQRSVTGYDILKWFVTDNSAEGKAQLVQDACTTALPIFRSAEARLIYMEAYYLRHNQLDATAKTYWRELRRRAGVSEDFEKTINNTDLSKENDLAIWSKGQLIDATLYNIRRERRCEFIAEGMRLDDLKRWRSLDMMKDYQPEGINLWDKQWEIWGSAIQTAGSVSQAGVSKYIRPLQAYATSVVYGGYNFPKQHYLEPIPLEDFNLTGGYGSSILYQNPGWPDAVDGIADYSYDCD